jgi:AraC family transcriptional regulator of arabinose operon
MAKTAEPGTLQAGVDSFFRWYRGDASYEEALPAIQSLLSSPLSLEDLKQFSIRLRQNQAFIARQQPLIDKWQDRMESAATLSDEQASELMQEIFDSFDHALLFEHVVTANSTLVQRGELGDSLIQLSGNMPCWTLHLTTQGKALFLSDHMEQEVGRGDMMLLRPNAQYHYGLHPSADEWEHLWALFQPRSHWTELLEWDALDNDLLFLQLPDPDSVCAIEQLFRQLIDLKDDSLPYHVELQFNRLEEILIRARQSAAPEEPAPMDQRIVRACDYMNAHLNQRFSIDDVAAACNLSPSRLSHLFKQQMGIGAKAWINGERLRQARKLLLGSEDSVSSIARQVGYEDPVQFSKYFKKNLGCSPRDFRNSVEASQSSL